jgi:outer membrane protein OmpA-like peptidoglycan-associated protein
MFKSHQKIALPLLLCLAAGCRCSPDQDAGGKPFEDGAKSYVVQVAKTDPGPLVKHVRFIEKTTELSGDSSGVLDEIVDALKDRPQIKRVEVQVFTDARGTSGYNLKVTQEQAETIVKHLVDKGVKPGIFVPAGYGEECPVEQGNSPGAFEKNRRVEFKILESGGSCNSLQLCPEALPLVPAEDRKYLSPDPCGK